MTPISRTNSPTVIPSPVTVPTTDHFFAVLSDRRADSKTVATLLRQALDLNCQPSLDEAIQSIIDRYGSFTVTDQVSAMLLEWGIDLQQLASGRITMQRFPLILHASSQRHAIVTSAMETVLPLDLIRLVNSYDVEVIGLNRRYETVIKKIFMADEPGAKATIITTAVNRRCDAWLEQILQSIRSETGDDLNLSHVILNGLVPGGLSFSRANLSGAQLSLLDLGNSNHVMYSNFTGAKLIAARLIGINFYGALLVNADLTRADLSGSELVSVDLTASILAGTKLKKARLDQARLIGANLTRANCDGANLSGADLRGAKLIGTNLRQADLTDADLRGADLAGADLAWANLTRANLIDANVLNVKYHYTKMDSVKWTGDGQSVMRVKPVKQSGGCNIS